MRASVGVGVGDRVGVVIGVSVGVGVGISGGVGVGVALGVVVGVGVDAGVSVGFESSVVGSTGVTDGAAGVGAIGAGDGGVGAGAVQPSVVPTNERINIVAMNKTDIFMRHPLFQLNFPSNLIRLLLTGNCLSAL